MAVHKGLASIRKQQEEQRARAEAGNRPKADWFKFGKGQTSYTVRFLQELDPEMDNYREDRGVGFIAVEHNAPGNDGWKRRGLCTIEDGACYACARHKQNYKEGWRQKQNLYINVLVNVGTDDNPDLKVMVMTRNANSGFVQALIEEAVDESTITAVNYRITKTGEGTTTQWLLKALKTTPFDDSNVEVFDLEKTAIREVEFDKQAEYYGSVYSDDEATPVGDSAPSSAKSAAPADDEW
jgi:hypothetical protein